MRIHMLDMGHERYGDSIVLRKGGRSILIDGAHPGDYQDRGEGYDDLPTQLEKIFGKQGPFKFDLLIVTHCHSDHIGCLPRLVQDGTIEVDTALVADEKLGFGRTSDDNGVTDATNPVDRIVAALREEDRAGMPDVELAQFIEDAATLEEKYRAMLKTLAKNGTVIRYRGESTKGLQKLEQDFAEFGLNILGPTSAHLIVCAEAIRKFSEDAARQIAPAVDATDTDAELNRYRSFRLGIDARNVDDSPYYEDRPGKGAALNDQSIIVKLSSGNTNILLTGDMQFAKAEIAGLEPVMRALRKTIMDAGPYQLIKLAHHASYNGLDEAVLDELGKPEILWISGGINDPGHPDAAVLQLLDERRNHLTWARTDKNGRCGVEASAAGLANHTKVRGRFKDGSPPGGDVGAVVRESGEAGGEPMVTSHIGRSAGGVKLEAHALVPDGTSQVVVTFDITGGDGQGDKRTVRAESTMRGETTATRESIGRVGIAAARDRLASGRRLPKLLFVTDSDKLSQNIGSREATAALQMIQAAQMPIVDVRGKDPFKTVRAALDGVEGVVIVGGYDVVPAQRLDVLTPQQRTALGGATDDSDDFIVWNDEIYGDRDADGLPELPVSRIPDGLSPEVVFNALTADDPRAPARFSVRNVARPFAAQIFDQLPGAAPILVSAKTSPATIGERNVAASHVYLMLHGSDDDTTRFWGETQQGGMFEAFDTSNVAPTTSGVVFTGCCWGALTVQQRASSLPNGRAPTPRGAKSSLALTFLQAGAKAFIGCTGSHYSPVTKPYDYFGGPMHAEFWKRLNAGEAPAKALFDAKLDFLRGMPHGQTTAGGGAIERKILKQFTCLGLGW